MGRREMHTHSTLGNMKQRPLGTPRHTHIRIILKMILKREDGRVWSGFI